MRRTAASALALVPVLAIAAVGASSYAPAQGLGPRPIDNTNRVVLRQSVHPLARPQFDAGRTSANLPMERIILALSPRPGAREQLDQLLADQQNPDSADYHRWVTPEEFGTRFGPSDEDLQTVTDWLESQGFRIDEVAKGRGWINFSGTARQVESAFATQMREYRVGGKLRHANALDPTIPRALSGVVKGIVSLNSFPRHPHNQGFHPRSVADSFPDFTDGTGPHAMAPADFATIYNLGPVYGSGVNGTGTTIAIVGRSDILLSDVQSFRSHYGLPANDPVFVHNGPAPGALGDDNEVEADLDVQWAGAVAPRATLKFVISSSTSTTDGVDLSAQYIVNHNLADAMSTSFGLCEADLGSGGNALYGNLWAQAAAQGITSFVSSGDSGAAGCDQANALSGSRGRAVSGLCTTPNNVCVGGSMFDEGSNPNLYWSASNNPTTQASALAYIPETSWNESGTVPGGEQLWASGGGASSVYPKPSWQAALGVPSDAKRDVPDVSLTAATHDGYLIAFRGLFGWVGGTSASSPSFAGLMALAVQKTGTRFGNVNPTLYKWGAEQYAGTGPVVFHDVTTGDNSVPGVTGFSAGAGYDLVTGLGSVDGNALISAFANLPKLSVSDVIVAEGDSGTVAAAFQVTLSAASTGTVTVNYVTADGTATAGSGDYAATSGTLTFTAGQTSKTVNVLVNGDALYEANETFTLNLSLPTNAQILDGQGQATITNDDAPPSLSIGDTSVLEWNSGTHNMSFTVTLSALSGVPASVFYATVAVPGTATAGSDYTAVSGGLTIPAGQLTGTINVPVKGDAVIEPDETFFVQLSSPVNATLVDGWGQGTILNDDAPGQAFFSLPNYTVSEAASLATITVKRVNGNAAGATIGYSTIDGTAVSVGPNADYAPTSGTLTFLANKTSAAFQIPITRDTIDEGNETVILRLSPLAGPTGTSIGTPSTAVLTITDNDTGGKIQFSSANYSVSEGAGSVKLTVRRTGGLASGVTVPYTVAPVGPAPATDGADYDSANATPPGVVTFAPSGIGATTQTITIPILQDSVPEGAETFAVTLGTPTGGGVLVLGKNVATVTILDDEPTVEFSAANYNAKESQPSALITVKRSGPPTGVVTVDYATGGGTATPDTGSGGDYKPVSGTLTFAKGVTSRAFTVPIIKDTLVEGPETVGLTLTNPVDLTSPGGIVLGTKATATLTIADDDATPTLQFSAGSYTVNEATPKATLVVKRVGNTSHQVSVEYVVLPSSTATPDVDYTLASPGVLTFTLTFNPGIVTQTILIPIVNDAIDEGTETVDLHLQNALDLTTATSALVGTPGDATLYITDNEPTVQFSAAAYSASEAAKSMVVTVKRTGPLTAPATVQYDVTGGSAVNGVDYTLTPSGTLSFAAGKSLATLPITLNPDTIADGPRTIDLDLTPLTGASLGTPGSTVVTIKDNDKAGKVQFGASDYSVAETAGAATITVTRSGGTSSQATVHYSTSDGSAAAPTDYTATANTLTFGLNEKSKTFTVPVVDNGTPDSGAVSVNLTLDTPANGLALGATSTATLWIVRE